MYRLSSFTSRNGTGECSRISCSRDSVCAAVDWAWESVRSSFSGDEEKREGRVDKSPSRTSYCRLIGLSKGKGNDVFVR